MYTQSTDVRTKVISGNQVQGGLWLARAWFNKYDELKRTIKYPADLFSHLHIKSCACIHPLEAYTSIYSYVFSCIHALHGNFKDHLFTMY